MNTWDLIKRKLESQLSADSYQNWVGKTEFSHLQDDKLCVTVPNEETRVWLDTEYSTLVNSLIRQMGVGLSGVIYQSGQNGKAPEAPPKEDLFDQTRGLLNPK